MGTSPTSSQISSLPLNEEKQIEEKTPVETLLDIKEEGKLFQRSPSSDSQQQEFNSSTDSQTNLLDDEKNLEKSLPQPMAAIKIIETKQESPSKTFLNRCQSFLMLEHSSFSTHSPFFFSSS